MFGRFGCLKIFQPQFQLLNLLIELLGAAPELHSLQLQDVELQRFDFVMTFVQRRTLLFDRGVLLFNEGDFRAALVEFRRAYEMTGNYKMLYNVGQTEYELQDYAGALKSFQRYLEAGGTEIESGRRAEVEGEVKGLGARVAHLKITSNVDGAEVLIDDVLIGKTPLAEPVLVSIGRRKVTLQKDGAVSAPRVVEVRIGRVWLEAIDGGPKIVSSGFTANVVEVQRNTQLERPGTLPTRHVERPFQQTDDLIALVGEMGLATHRLSVVELHPGVAGQSQRGVQLHAGRLGLTGGDQQLS